jgi:hypothetical protein
VHWQKFILWLFCLTVLGCESELGERYACRYQANMPRECNLETEFSQQPQLSPKMVIYEVDRYHGLEPSSDQELAAQELVRRSFEVAKKRGWYDIDQADRDGYRQLFQDRVHFANEAFIMDDYILDPERPEYLMYYDTPKGRQLAGFMFVVRSPDDEGPQIGGALTKWHYHVWSTPFCLKNGMMTVGVPDRNGCSVGQPRQRSPEMIHVWLVDHPLGVFSGQMRVPKELMLELFEKRGL